MPTPLDFRLWSNGAAFVLKLDATALSPIWLRYLGGNFGAGLGVRVAASGGVWVTGATFSANTPFSTPFPTVHPFQADTGQGFVALLSADGSSLAFSTLMDYARGIDVDADGNAFVVGNRTFPIVLLVRIDAAVTAQMTAEKPERLVPAEPLYNPLPGIAPGEIVVIKGDGLGPAQPLSAQLGPDGRLAKSLGGTAVLFDGVPAPLLSVAAEKVVCIAPFSV